MPAGIVLTGGTANLFNISKLTKNYYNTPVRIGYPSGLSGMVEEINYPQFSAVQGLIKHGIDNLSDTSVVSSVGMQQRLTSVMDKMLLFLKQLKP
jgi:cell division protein FtsA